MLTDLLVCGVERLGCQVYLVRMPGKADYEVVFAGHFTCFPALTVYMQSWELSRNHRTMPGSAPRMIRKLLVVNQTRRSIPSVRYGTCLLVGGGNSHISCGEMIRRWFCSPAWAGPGTNSEDQRLLVWRVSCGVFRLAWIYRHAGPISLCT